MPDTILSIRYNGKYGGQGFFRGTYSLLGKRDYLTAMLRKHMTRIANPVWSGTVFEDIIFNLKTKGRINVSQVLFGRLF